MTIRVLISQKHNMARKYITSKPAHQRRLPLPSHYSIPFYSTASPSSRITCTISSTYFAHNSSLCASTITRITGSVPLSRRRILPSSSKAVLIRSFSACTRALPVTAALSSTFTFFKSCGYICIPLHSVPRLCFFSRITSISINAVRIPSPVVACLLKMICPDCSPPSTYPLATIASLTYLSPTVVTHTPMPSRFIALNNPMLDMIVATTVLFCRRPHSFRYFPQTYRI